MLLLTLISKNILGAQSILLERIFESERSWNYYYVFLQFSLSVTPKGFNNIPFKSLTRKKLLQLAEV